MNKVKKIKHLIRLKMVNVIPAQGWKLLQKINLIFFHWSEREHKEKLGKKNPEKIFYVIRSSGKEEGLLSYYLRTLELVYSACKKGYIPFVDNQNYRTQYSMDKKIKGTKNAWEYYFEQPCEYTLDEIYQSKNVIFSGWNLSRKEKYLKKIEFNSDKERVEFIERYLDVKPYIKEIVEQQMSQWKADAVLGVFLRGTDYVALKPKGHPIQPSVDEIDTEITNFIKKFRVDKIFLATEDASIFNFFKEKYGEKIISSDYNFIENYDGKDYLVNYKEKKDMYEDGLNYLVKMLCLAQCDYLISSLASGSIYAILKNQGLYKEKIVYDKGVY